MLRLSGKGQRMDNTKKWLRRKIETFCAALERNILLNKSLKCKVVFGPVHSRRLGLVIGVNNIKPSTCSYNCIYCSSGYKTCCSVCTSNCISPYELHASMRNKLTNIDQLKDKINYIVFTGSGEPALDTELSKEITILREFGYKIAVFTNASLIWNAHIRENLMFADYVSLKIDTVNPETWLKINRPHKRLSYDLILDGIKQFSKIYKGKLSTETMLIKDINDNKEEVEKLANYLNTINREVSYFTTPVFPPQESYVTSPDSDNLEFLKSLIKEKVSKAVLLCCPDNEECFTLNDFKNELLGLLAIHPIGVETVKQFVKKEVDTIMLNEMIERKIIEEVDFHGKKYFKECAAL